MPSVTFYQTFYQTCYMTKETYYMAKETYYMTKETYYMAKETFYMTKETNIHARGTHSQGCGQMKKKIKQIFVRGRHILKHEANEYIHALEDTYSDVVKYIYLHISSYVHVCIYIHAWETRTHT